MPGTGAMLYMPSNTPEVAYVSAAMPASSHMDRVEGETALLSSPFTTGEISGKELIRSKPHAAAPLTTGMSSVRTVAISPWSISTGISITKLKRYASRIMARVEMGGREFRVARRSLDTRCTVVRIHAHARHKKAPHIATARRAARGLCVASPRKRARLGPLMKGQKNAMPMTINARCFKGVAPMVVVG